MLTVKGFHGFSSRHPLPLSLPNCSIITEDYDLHVDLIEKSLSFLDKQVNRRKSISNWRFTLKCQKIYRVVMGHGWLCKLLHPFSSRVIHFPSGLESKSVNKSNLESKAKHKSLYRDYSGELLPSLCLSLTWKRGFAPSHYQILIRIANTNTYPLKSCSITRLSTHSYTHQPNMLLEYHSFVLHSQQSHKIHCTHVDLDRQRRRLFPAITLQLPTCGLS